MIPPRFRFEASWHLTWAGFVWPLVGRGCDESHNRTLYLVLPLVGMFTLWLDRSAEDHVGVVRTDEGVAVVDHLPVEGCSICDEIVADLSADGPITFTKETP